MSESEPTSRFSLAGKTALVTGGSKGIGAETALNLSRAGAAVAVAGRDRVGLDAVCATIRAEGGRCETVEADLATAEGAEATARAALACFPTIDILVNNAGIARVAPFWELSVDDWDLTQAVNLRAPFILAQVLSGPMREQRRGKIINISSVAGVTAQWEHAAYTASKGGLNLLTKVMAIELAPYNVQCNAVAPTVILTAMGREVWGPPEKGDPMKAKIPMNRFGEPAEVADLVLYLASPASDFLTGQVIAIDGGYTAV